MAVKKAKVSVKQKKETKKRGITHSFLVEKGIKWLKSQGGYRWSCGVVFGELSAATDEKPDVLGFSSNSSTLIECKTSKSDFKRDQKKMFRSLPQKGMGKYRFYMCPTDLIKEEELPDKWGLIYVSEGGMAKVIKLPENQFNNLQAENAYMYSIIRRYYNKNNEDIKKFENNYAK